MALNVTVNGAVLEVDSEITVSVILTELKRQGWKVEGVCVNGADLSLERAAQFEGVEGTIEFEAKQPGASPQSEGPSPEGSGLEGGGLEASAIEPEALAEQLCGSIPQFREIAESMGDEFSRGQWKSGLERLTTWLEELKIVLGGFQVIQTLRPGSAGHIAQMPPLLEELSSHLQNQSWVEVADVLLYEFVPAFEAWEASLE